MHDGDGAKPGTTVAEAVARTKRAKLGPVLPGDPGVAMTSGGGLPNRTTG